MTLTAYALALGAATVAAEAPVELAQLVIRQRVVIRVPAMPVQESRRPAPQTRWVEKKGPKCLPMNALAGASITRPDAVDLVLRGGLRVRAQLADECPALDYYSGFYITPTPDGQVCADRDAIRSRAGGECAIERFRRLVPGK